MVRSFDKVYGAVSDQRWERKITALTCEWCTSFGIWGTPGDFYWMAKQNICGTRCFNRPLSDQLDRIIGERTRKRHLRTLVRKSSIYRTDSKVSENRVRRRDHGQFTFRTRKRTNVPATFMSGVRKTYLRVQTPTGDRSRRICEAICGPKRSIHAWIVS